MTDSVLLVCILVVAGLCLVVEIANYLLGLKTAKGIDGRMDELLVLTRKEAGNEATIVEKTAQSQREVEAKRAHAMVDVFQQGVKKGENPGHDERSR